MDKYEYNLKLDQMKSLCAEENYAAAAEIADSISWNKIKNVNALVKAGEIYERMERYEESRDILLMAYDRSPVGRTILYRLTEVAIKMNDFASATEYYNEFVEIAPHDNLRYTLRYHMRQAQGAQPDELIPILEELNEIEYTEEWAYELAYLYHKAGMSDKCVSACDELILWFGEGPYVERALELKMLYQPLSKSQEEKYRRARADKQGLTMIDADAMVKGGEYVHDPVEIPSVAVNVSKFNTVNLQEEIAKGIQQIMEATEKETVTDTMDNIKKIVEEIPYLQLQMGDTQKIAVQQQREADAVIDGSLKSDFEEMLGDEDDEAISTMTHEQAILADQITGQMSISEVLDDWEKTKRAAEAALMAADQRKLESAKAAALQEAGDLMDRLNDVIPKLDAGVSPSDLLKEEYLQRQDEEPEEDTFDLEKIIRQQEDSLPDIDPVLLGELSAQASGQTEEQLLDNANKLLEDEISRISGETEALDEKLKAAEELDAAERSAEDVDADIEKALDDVMAQVMQDVMAETGAEDAAEPEDTVETVTESEDAAEPEEVVTEPEDAAESEEVVTEPEDAAEPEKVMTEPEDAAESEEVVIESEDAAEEAVTESEEIADAVAESEDAAEAELDAAIEDITEKLENALNSDSTVDLEDVPEADSTEESEDVMDMAAEPEEVTEPEEEELQDTSEKETVTIHSIEDLQRALNELEENSIHKTKKMPTLEELMKAISAGAAEEAGTAAAAASWTQQEPPIARMEDIIAQEEAKAEEALEQEHLTDSQKAVFSYFVPVAGMEHQLSHALNNISEHLLKEESAHTGNLIVQGGKGCGKTVLATSMIRALQKEIGRPNNKVGKINAGALNKKDLQLLLRKVQGGCLIIEQAGDLSKQSAVSLSLLLGQDTSGILVVLEDTPKGIRKALLQDEGFAKKFTETITVPIFTNDELVSFAESYSKELGYKIDEMAILALHNRISNIQRLDQETTLTEVKEIVDEAIRREANSGLRKFFGNLTAKRFTEDDRIVLQEKDFA